MSPKISPFEISWKRAAAVSVLLSPAALLMVSAGGYYFLPDGESCMTHYVRS